MAGGLGELGREEVLEVGFCCVDGDVDEEEGAVAGGGGDVGGVRFKIEVVGSWNGEGGKGRKGDREDVEIGDHGGDLGVGFHGGQNGANVNRKVKNQAPLMVHGKFWRWYLR